MNEFEGTLDYAKELFKSKKQEKRKRQIYQDIRQIISEAIERLGSSASVEDSMMGNFKEVIIEDLRDEGFTVEASGIGVYVISGWV